MALNQYEEAIVEALRRKKLVTNPSPAKSIDWASGDCSGCETCGWSTDEGGFVVYHEEGITEIPFWCIRPTDLVKGALEVLNESETSIS